MNPETLDRHKSSDLRECGIEEEFCIACSRNILEKKYFYFYSFVSGKAEKCREGYFCSLKCYHNFNTFEWKPKED